jgi:hypothetical protein
VRAGWAPVAGAGAAGRRSAGAVGVRAADGHVVGPAAEELTWDKTDERDAVLIARLTAQLRCYVLGPAGETWAARGIWVPATSS